MSARSAFAQPCSVSGSITFGPTSQYGTARLTVSNECSGQAPVTASAAWVHAGTSAVLSPPQSGMLVQVDPNTTGASRVATIAIGGSPAVTVTQGSQPCISGYSPSPLHVPYTGIDEAGGSSFAVSVQTSTADCAWAIDGWPGWMLPTLSGAGNGPLRILITANASTTSSRTATITYGGAPLVIEQDGAPCLFSVTPSSVNMPANGGTGSFDVTGAGTNCPYTAVSSYEGVTITSGATGTAPATISYRVAPNRLPRNTWTISVVNATFAITQNGAPIERDTPFFAHAVALGPGPTVRRSSEPRLVRITNAEQVTASYSAVADQPWVKIAQPSGNTPATLSISIDPVIAATLAPGFYRAQIALTSSIAPTVPALILVDLSVFGIGQSSTPFGVFDTPIDGAVNLSGALPVTGWALDRLGIRRVSIYRDNVAGEPDGLVFIGDATRVGGARPDVAGPLPESDRAGWGYMLLSNVLPGGGNGTFTFSAYAENVDGNLRLLGRKRVAFNNAAATRPFGTIDTPAQGETVSGTIVNNGWVLTPAGKTVPFDGSTIKVYVDGALLAPVTAYNLPRPDVKGFFPGLANSNGPGARLSIDTTLLADGVHTIAWGVIDDAGVAEGIGSRYFTVQNGAASQVQLFDPSRAASVVARLPVMRTEVWSREGVDDTAWAVRVEADAHVRRRVLAGQGRRLELFLDPTLQSACGTFEGHLITGGVAAPLPAGASLDGQHGIFRWQPGPEFTGDYAFVFVQRGCDGMERRIPMTIAIRRVERP